MDYSIGYQIGIALLMAFLFGAIGTGVAAAVFGAFCRGGLDFTQNLRNPTTIAAGGAYALFAALAIASSSTPVPMVLGMLALPGACFGYLHFAPRVMQDYIREWFDAIEEYAARSAEILEYADADQDGVVCRHDFTTSEQALLSRGISTNLINKMKMHFDYFGHRLRNEGTVIISAADPAATRTKFRSDYVGWIADYEGWAERYKPKA